ncbi:hypothetical protein FEO94_00615 [Stenotrophomonas maltophilia]|nr:hypothetical protein FEO94_00615 [Stenotrophomonas maltophilia]
MTVAVAPDTYRAGTAVPLSLHDRRGREGGPGRVSGLSLAPGWSQSPFAARNGSDPLQPRLPSRENGGDGGGWEGEPTAIAPGQLA